MERYSSEYRPDPAFTKKLKELDPRLGCKFRHDLRRFAVTFDRAVGSPAEVLIVKGEYGEFRQPDERELKVLNDGDLQKTDIRTRLDRADNYMRDYRKKQEKEISDRIDLATKDDRIQLKNAYRKSFNTGGKPSEFRRIIHKPKGKKASALSKNR